MMPWLTPTMIAGIAIGILTLVSVCSIDAPNEFETSSICSGSSRMPSVVQRTSGGNA